jgi:hypothetical protein
MLFLKFTDQHKKQGVSAVYKFPAHASAVHIARSLAQKLKKYKKLIGYTVENVWRHRRMPTEYGKHITQLSIKI